MMTRPRACWGCCLMFLLVLAQSGCGDTTGVVSGTVRLKGAAVPGGQVTFTSQTSSGESAFGWIGEDGSYVVQRCPIGPVRIIVLPLERRRGGKGLANPQGTVAAKGAKQRRKPPAIPMRY